MNREIFDAIGGMEAEDQIRIDRVMRTLDGTPNKSRLGANAILGVSLAVAKAAAMRARPSSIPLSRRPKAHVLPVPMMNIVNGGAHADNAIDFQEFMILPLGASSSGKRCEWGWRFSTRSSRALSRAGHNTNVGDEGGFAPGLASADEALGFIVRAIERAGYRPGDDVALALDPASSEFFKSALTAGRRRANARR